MRECASTSPSCSYSLSFSPALSVYLAGCLTAVDHLLLTGRRHNKQGRQKDREREKRECNCSNNKLNMEARWRQQHCRYFLLAAKYDASCCCCYARDVRKKVFYLEHWRPNSLLGCSHSSSPSSSFCLLFASRLPFVPIPLMFVYTHCIHKLRCALALARTYL